jgi:hypothetical protein
MMTRWIANSVVMVLSFLVALFLCETAIRICGYRPLDFDRDTMPLGRYDSVLGWHHEPGQNARSKSPFFDISVNINRHGLRGRDHDLTKQAGKKRVVVLGDSMVWGHGVAMEKAFTELIEAELPNVEVINAGVRGYSTDQELLWFEREGVKYDPDLVVLVLYSNDPEGNVMDMVYFKHFKPTFALDVQGKLVPPNGVIPRPSLVRTVVEWISERSALAYFLVLAHSRSTASTMESPRVRDSKEKDLMSNEVYAVRLTAAMIHRIAEITRDKKAEFLLVTHCEDNQPCNKVAEVLQRDGLLLLDLGKAKGWSPDQMTFSKRDPHWNEKGHMFVAETLLEFIRKNKLLETGNTK